MLTKDALTRVTTFTETITANTSSWKLPFNQAIFLNYDINQPAFINTDVIVPQAQLNSVGGIVPSFFKLSLNYGEVNDSNFNFSFNGSTTIKLVIIHTEYNVSL